MESPASTLSVKIDLIHWLTELEDPAILEQLKDFKEAQESPLSQAHKELLDQRIASFEKNPDQLVDWEIAMKELDKGI